MPQQPLAARLLDDLHCDAPALRDIAAAAAGINIERADAAMIGSVRLTLAEQLRLAETTLLIAPKFARVARRLREQALAAKSFESAEFVERHPSAPLERWECSPQLRR